jgi:hypothetical protein
MNETAEILRPRQLFRGHAAHKYRIRVDGKDVTADCVGASDTEGWAEVFDMLDELPEGMAPFTVIPGRGNAKNYIERNGKYVLMDHSTGRLKIKRLEGTVSIELIPEAA